MFFRKKYFYSLLIFSAASMASSAWAQDYRYGYPRENCPPRVVYQQGYYQQGYIVPYTPPPPPVVYYAPVPQAYIVRRRHHPHWQSQWQGQQPYYRGYHNQPPVSYGGISFNIGGILR